MPEPDPPATSRRGFLAGAAGAAVGAGLLAGAGTAAAYGGNGGNGGAGSAASPHPAPDAPLPAHPHHNRRRFEDAPGGKVTVRLDDGPVVLEIAMIEPLSVAAEAKAGTPLWRDAFRVTLVGPKGTDIPQGTHRVSIGGRSFNLFVVPILSRGSGRRFEAIINRAYHGRAHA
jgi:hypothetical protein